MGIVTTPALIWADIRYKAQKKGFLRACRFAARRMTWPDVFHFQRLYVLSRPILPDVPDLQPDVPITFRLATQDDLPLLAQIHEYPSEQKDVADKLRRGDLVILAFHDEDGQERLVGHHMASLWRETPIPHEIDLVEISRHFELNEQDAYTHNFLVIPAYRGLRVAAPMGFALMRVLYERGYRRIFTTIAVNNEPSLRASRRMGSRVVARMDSLQAPGWRHIWTTLLEHDPLAGES